MNMTRVLLLCLIFFRSVLCAQEPAKPAAKPDAAAEIKVASAPYHAAVEAVSAEYQKWIAALDTWYLAELDKLQAARAKLGDLDGAIAIKKERERMASHSPTTPEQIQAMPAPLRTLRAGYDQGLKKSADEGARRIDTARRKYLADLEALQKRITTTGDIDKALLVKAEKDRFIAEMAAGPAATISQPATFARYAGVWLIRYQNGAIRQYTIEPNGDVEWTDFNPAKKGRITAQGNDHLLDFEDGKIERISVNGSEVRIEHFDPMAKYRDRLPGLSATVTKATPVSSAPPSAATKDKPFVNSLGMEFVPVPGTQVLFSRWETRVRDYAEYAGVNKVDDSWKKQEKDGVPVGREPEHPVCAVGWDDAKAFCEWLTKKDIAGGKLPTGMQYRLPTDEEWSRAVGMAKEEGATPKDRHSKGQVDFPWGTGYPPSKGKLGNYADESFHKDFPKESDRWIQGYTDGFATTAPVGSFAANNYGIHDLGGNVWECCEDWYDTEQKEHLLRGASWQEHDRGSLLSSNRYRCGPDFRRRNVGFRRVLGASAR